MSEQEDVVVPILNATPRESVGSGGISFSSNSSTSTSCSSSAILIKTALSDCSGAWVNYLNVLNTLCTAGTKLAQSIATLEICCQNNEKTSFRQMCNDKTIPPNTPSSYMSNSWNDLARATTVATSTVKSHIAVVLQDLKVLSTLESNQLNEQEQQRIRDHNKLVIIENVQTMINIQQQFCTASYDAFSSLTCCFVCQALVGFPHDPECSMIKPKSQVDERSHTPSPHFGTSHKFEPNRAGSNDQKNFPFGPSTSQMCNESMYNAQLEQINSQSPQSSLRDMSPLQSILENIRGPLPNPGRLLGMKMPFYRNAKSPLNFPLFPLNGQRRWSEAAAGEVNNENLTDVECQMRRWSMPWEASKSDKNTVTWYQTRMMPMNNVKQSQTKFTNSERSTSNTPDSPWQTSVTSQDGLAEAIQLLSCKPILYPPQVLLKQQQSFDVSVVDDQISAISSMVKK